MKNSNTFNAKSCLYRGMWNSSRIWQNPVYVDALSNPFTQYYSQVTIDVYTFNGVRTFSSYYSQLSWTRASSELVVPEHSQTDVASNWHVVNSH
jgi:hypothetical protein